MYAEIILSEGLPKTLFYSIPTSLSNKVFIGQAVTVPLKSREVLGYVYKLHPTIPPTKFEIKNITSIKAEKSFFNHKIVELIEWLSAYYISPLSLVIKSVLPLGRKSKTKINIDDYELKEPNHKNTDIKETKLSDHQNQVFNKIKENPSNYFLIHGITGSGKTAVYLKLIEHYWKQDKSSLILVPEIALTYQIHAFINQIYGDSCLVLHSKITQAKRRDAWLKIYHSKKIVVIGTRMAIFTPINNLGLIILDEEQDPSYKQDNNPSYNARVVAYKKAQIEGAQLILGTATPLVTTFYQAQTFYKITELTERYFSVDPPEIKVVNLKKTDNYPKNLLSPELVKTIKKTLDQKEQIILLYNQRGLSKVLRCEDCGTPVECENCSVTMTLHESKKLICHYCGSTTPTVDICPNCQSLKMRAMGKGIQALVTEVKKTFPYANIHRLDSDIASEKEYVEKTLNEFRKETIDILIGTQMIAKGHHFPQVTCVGVIDADLGLSLPDLYATERTFDLLTQVCGRAGRERKNGVVVIQTFNPEHYAVKTAINNDYKTFYETEIENRRKSFNPPFSRLIRVSFNHKNEEKVKEEINLFFKKLNKKFPNFHYLPPISSLISKLKNKYRWHFIIKLGIKENPAELKEYLLKAYLAKISSSINYDINPVNTMF